MHCTCRRPLSPWAASVPPAWRCVPSLFGCPAVAVPTQGWSHCQVCVPVSLGTLLVPVRTRRGDRSRGDSGLHGKVTARTQWPVPLAWLHRHRWHSPCQSRPSPAQDRSRDCDTSVTPPGARLFPSSSLLAPLLSPHSVLHTPGALLAQPGSNV